MEEIARGLDDLVRTGKIVYGGLSNFPAWRIATAANTADLRGWRAVCATQIEYNLLQRTPDRDLLPVADGFGLGVVPIRRCPTVKRSNYSSRPTLPPRRASRRSVGEVLTRLGGVDKEKP
ncbi:MAG: norsolorinic acid reductase [Bryobacterales bacterium]|nr:norsolorinic acid reductase [Bryobacterales bacterium]